MVFAKAPVPGRVKTRLVAALGERAAAELHRQLAERTLFTALAAGLLVGSDCPVLIGLARSPAAPLFEDIAWGTATVMQETRARLARLDWRWCELATLWDVDRPEDLLRLARPPDGQPTYAKKEMGRVSGVCRPPRPRGERRRSPAKPVLPLPSGRNFR